MYGAHYTDNVVGGVFALDIVPGSNFMDQYVGFRAICEELW